MNSITQEQTNTIKIFIDDERECPEGFLYAKTFEEAQNLLLTYKDMLLFVTLDNDLNQGFKKTGIQLFSFMEKNKIYPLRINCHTGSFPEIMAEVAKELLPETTIITTNQTPPYDKQKIK